MEGFDCGNEALNHFLIRHALRNQQAEDSKTYIALMEEEIIGYYTLVFGGVNFEEVPERLKKGVARHPVPIMLLARLAVHLTWQRKGIGRGLLKDALLRTLQAVDIGGLRAVVAHAKNDEARTWYEQFDFIPAPTDPYHLFILVKDIRALRRRQFRRADF